MSRLVFILTFFSAFSGLSLIISETWFTALVLATGIPHILLGAKYSSRGFSNAWAVSWQKALLLILFPICFIVGVEWPVLGLVIYFGIHHGISETYSNVSKSVRNRVFTLAYFTLVACGYFFACRNDVLIGNSSVVLYSLIALTVAAMAIALFEAKTLLSKDFRIKDYVLKYPWLIGTPFLIGISLIIPVSWKILILYHFTFWGLLPLFRKSMFKNNATGLKKFWKDAIVWNGSWLIIMSMLAVYSNHYVDFRIFQFILLAFYIATYWHITVSFIISGANPSWIKRIFSAS